MNNEFITRAYNSIEYNINNFSVIKKSNNKKLIDEIKYLNNVPQKLKRFFPHLINAGTNMQRGNYTMELEFFPYPNLGTIMTKQKYNKKLWKDVAKS